MRSLYLLHEDTGKLFEGVKNFAGEGYFECTVSLYSDEDYYPEHIIKFGGIQKAYDAWSSRNKSIDYSRLEEGMESIVRALNDNDLYTTMCCCGHGEEYPWVMFDTCVPLQKIIKSLDTSTFYCVKAIIEICPSTQEMWTRYKLFWPTGDLSIFRTLLSKNQPTNVISTDPYTSV